MRHNDISRRLEDPLHDLVSPDGIVVSLTSQTDKMVEAEVFIPKLSPWFRGFDLPKECLFFNGKSVLAQLGVNILGTDVELSKETLTGRAAVRIEAIGPIAREFIRLLRPGARIGKLFAKDENRCVRNPDYITRMFGRSDRWGKPLLSLGGLHGSDALIMDTVDGRAVAYLSLLNGRVQYAPSIFGFLPTIAKSLELDSSFKLREMLQMHQIWQEGSIKNVQEDEILLVKTPPLHIRTVFAHVVESLLAPGFSHTTASILEPNTQASGDIYEFLGTSRREITDIPLEFYTLEPFREHVFFTDRDRLQANLESFSALEKAMQTAPQPSEDNAAVFIVKGEQLENLSTNDWVAKDPLFNELPGISHGPRQAHLLERFIKSQPMYPFLRAIETGYITSQGVMLSRFFPSPLLKRMLLSEEVARCLRGVYFLQPSRTHGDFFSIEDRALLNDLHKFAIPVYWVDRATSNVLQYVQKPQRDSGMFVPNHKVDHFMQATIFGVYGSNLVVGPFEAALQELLSGVMALRSEVNHPLLNKKTPLALVTGGGPGAMEVANKLAKELGILSCANIADFRLKGEAVVNEQKQNPYVEAKMTYRLKDLVERQSEFNLDFPIFVTGGVGTDFEYCLEEVRRKVGCVPPTPILLFGPTEYWKKKISSRYQCNLEYGTIKGSEWLSGTVFCVNSAQEGLEVYRRYFTGELITGKGGEVSSQGFLDATHLKE